MYDGGKAGPSEPKGQVGHSPLPDFGRIRRKIWSINRPCITDCPLVPWFRPYISDPPPFFGPSDGTAKLLAKMLRSAKSSWLAATAPTQHTAQCSLSPKHCLPGDLTAKNCGICNWQQQDYNVWQYLADFLSNTPKEIYIRQCFALAICLCMAKTKQILIYLDLFRYSNFELTTEFSSFTTKSIDLSR